MVMNRGKRAQARGTHPAEVLSDPEFREAYLGSEEVANV
jgi:ABC-type branched-subunit amino acid transport system ATPase component